MIKFPRRLWLDFETGGFNARKDDIVEIACILEFGNSTHYFHRYICPDPFPPDYDKSEAVEKHKLTSEFLKKNGIPQYKAFNDFTSWLGRYINNYNKKDKLVLCGKKLDSFDVPFLRQWFKKNNNKYYGSYFFSVCIDVQSQMAQILSEEEVDLEHFTLTDMCKFASVELTQAHSARADIKATREVYYKMLEKMK